MAILCVVVGLAVMLFDRPSRGPRDIASTMAANYVDAFSIGITMPENMQNVMFTHVPRLELFYDGGNEMTGWFKTGISESSQPSTAALIVSLPASAVIGDPYLVISYSDIARQNHRIPDLRWGNRLVEVDPPTAFILGDALLAGTADSRRIVEEAKRRARHRRVIVAVPVDPVFQGFTFTVDGSPMFRRLGFGRTAVTIWYMRPALLGLDQIVTTNGRITDLETVTTVTLSDQTEHLKPARIPSLILALADSFDGQFEEVAPDPDTNTRYSRQWTATGEQATLIQADIVNHRIRLWISLLSGLVFTGIGFFLGSLEWKTERSRRSHE
jgi:hypothetical protein